MQFDFTSSGSRKVRLPFTVTFEAAQTGPDRGRALEAVSLL